MTVKTGNNKIGIGVNQDERGRFIKGNCANPYGNKHTKNIDDLITALDEKAKRNKYKNFEAFVAKKCFEDNTVLIAILRKIYPDKLQGQGFGDSKLLFQDIQIDNRASEELLKEINSRLALQYENGK